MAIVALTHQDAVYDLDNSRLATRRFVATPLRSTVATNCEPRIAEGP